MNEIINIYCDESCHLENDNNKVMVLGAVWCPSDKKDEIFTRIKEIKRTHSLSLQYEAKWTKISNGKIDFYNDLINYFFDNDNLHFRTLVIPDKSILRHGEFRQDHNTWYYKMYFNMLKVIVDPHKTNRIFLDIKDSRSSEKIKKLQDVLCSANYDFNRDIIKTVQTVRSHEIEIMQITDILIGAISYINRSLETSQSKLEIINLIKKRSGYSLKLTTYIKENKFNIFVWHPKETQ